jgi:hypothetical protein
MDRMIKSAPMSGGISDSAYDRSEDAITKMQTCEYCEGHGVIEYCAECDEYIDNCKCEAVRCLAFEQCEHCDGEGEVEI